VIANFLILTVYTAFRKHEVTIFSSMTEVEFSLVEPASLFAELQVKT
jgi:hypothetical protein